MNIFLIPYTIYRHFAVALVCAGAALIAWWLVLMLAVGGAPWAPVWDGAAYLGATGAVVSGASLLAEGTLRRTKLWKRVLFTFGGMAVTAGLIVLAHALWSFGLSKAFLQPTNADPTLTTLRFRLPEWITVGLSCTAGTLPFRKLKGFFAHVIGGPVSGLAAGAAWYIAGNPLYVVSDDLYLASAVGSCTLGFCFGLFAWGVPDELYAGWLRIVTETRHGRRIPIDTHGEHVRERFVGHFPRGLDLFLPATEGVMELHTSVLVTKDRVYKARGLTLQPTAVRRFLERLDLRYDSRRPVPLETKLASGDRIVLGPPGNQTVLEFIMLPREEQ